MTPSHTQYKMPTTRSQKLAAAAVAAAAPRPDRTVDDFVFHLRSGIKSFCWYGVTPLSEVLKNTLGHKIVRRKTLNIQRSELNTDRRWEAVTPLILAVQQPGDASELIREMVNVHGCDPNFKNAHGKSPMYYAILTGNRAHAKTLVECGAVVGPERHYSPVGGPDFDGGWENVPMVAWYAKFIV